MTTPLAPTLLSPASGALVDPASGVPFSWDFRDPDPGDTQSAFAFRRKAQGQTAYEYWTGSGWSSSLTWVSSTTEGVTIPFAHWYMTWPDVNLLSEQGSQAESSVSAWGAGSNTTLTQGVVIFKQGTKATVLQSNAAGDFFGAFPNPVNSAPHAIAVSPGEILSGRCWAKMHSTTRNAKLRIQFYTAAPAFLSLFDGDALSVGTSQWVALENIGVVVPATAAWVQIIPLVGSAAAAGEKVSIDAAVLVRGTSPPMLSQVWQWSVATKDAAGTIGPFANDALSVIAEAPIVTATAPTGSVTASRPMTQWGTANVNGYASSGYEIKVFSAAQYGAGGFDPSTSDATWESGFVEDSDAYVAQIDVDLATGTTYRAYVRVTNTGGQVSGWSYSQFTTSLSPPAQPTVTVTVDPDTGTNTVTIETPFNFLTAAQADFEVDEVEGWENEVGCDLAISNAAAAGGTRSLLVTIVGEDYADLSATYATYTNLTTAFATYDLMTAAADT